MIFASVDCPHTWTREYYGYVTSEDSGYDRPTVACGHNQVDSLPASSGIINYTTPLDHVNAVCHYGLSYPPYYNYKELNCVMVN